MPESKRYEKCEISMRIWKASTLEIGIGIKLRHLATFDDEDGSDYTRTVGVTTVSC